MSGYISALGCLRSFHGVLRGKSVWNELVNLLTDFRASKKKGLRPFLNVLSAPFFHTG